MTVKTDKEYVLKTSEYYEQQEARIAELKKEIAILKEKIQ